MLHSTRDIVDILKKYIQQQELSQQEYDELQNWIQSKREHEVLIDNLLDTPSLAADLKNYKNALENRENNREKFHAAISKTTSRVVAMRTRWIRYAAILLLTIGAGITIFIAGKQKAVVATHDLSQLNTPANPGVILTLSDGSEIMLDSIKNAMITNEQGARISLDKDELVYNPSEQSGAEFSYNKISTPKGKQLKITLPDGSRVWLNAMSSLRYPVSFKENERKVEVSGEAFFEVAKNASQPFILDLGNAMSVEVLGTSFNINSYPDEASINTTLMEGIVKVKDSLDARVLQPGQQCRLSRNGEATLVRIADIEQVIAWKKGIFDFDNMNLSEVLRQVERWYDIQVVYQDGIPEVEFGGKISRSLPLPDLIHFLEGAGVHIQLTGTKLMVLR